VGGWGGGATIAKRGYAQDCVYSQSRFVMPIDVRESVNYTGFILLYV